MSLFQVLNNALQPSHDLVVFRRGRPQMLAIVALFACRLGSFHRFASRGRFGDLDGGPESVLQALELLLRDRFRTAKELAAPGLTAPRARDDW